MRPGPGFVISFTPRHFPQSRLKMKQTIKHTALASTLLLAAVAARYSPAADRQDKQDKQDDTIGTESRTVAPFTSINISGPFRVIVTAQGGNSVELSGLRRKFADIETSVAGDTLTVRQPRQKNNGWSFNFSWGKK